MEIRTLKYFLEIAQTGNMTRAAENLHVSQSALSRQMSDLEDELGKTLFIRTNKNTRLTEDGLHLKRRAGEIISLLNRTRAEFSEDGEDVRGDIYIGAGETPAMETVATAIRRTREKHPQINFHLYSGTAELISERLEHGLLDFALFIAPDDIEKYSYISIPSQDIGGIYVRKDHPLAEKASVSLPDLQNIPVLCSTRQLDFIRSLWHELHLPPESFICAATFNLFYNAALLVKAKIGCAISIAGLSDCGDDSVIRFIPFAPTVQAPIFFAWKKFQELSKACAVFLQELQIVLGE